MCDRCRQSAQDGKHVETGLNAVQYRIVLLLTTCRFPIPCAKVERVGMLQHVSDSNMLDPAAAFFTTAIPPRSMTLDQSKVMASRYPDIISKWYRTPRIF